ncbi:acetyl-CoA hydrolase [Alicyclobacillus tolerans]|uniref:acetyl-CoA hydrolase/transferase family protein n=1 Tax=Alicyclobacillus tolerans TaxID=90970 RepID=UPI001F2C676A|nr:acetyl-CoA hydrolase/transferase C-terminal domain-containing protein [Alicyclobacillus tolerans]MCF8565300.1 acetyl-CoA hydrolase [Alicyclobacillus tolerans]
MDFNNDFKVWIGDEMAQQITATEAAALVQPGMRVALGSFCAEPQTLAQALTADSARLNGVKLYVSVLGSACPYAHSDSFRIAAFLSSPRLRSAYTAQRVDYIPMDLSAIPTFFQQHPVDVAMVQCSTPDGEGNVSLGVSVDAVRSLVRHSRIVVAEMNAQMPWTLGSAVVPLSEFDFYVPTDRPLLEVRRGERRPVEEQIAQHVAEWVQDGATIQIGVGSLSESILEALSTKQDLGVHSGMFSDGVMALMQKGVVTNRFKDFDVGVSVATCVVGTQEVYRFVHQNEHIRLMESNYTHHPGVLARLSKFAAINSALEVDLTGQVNAETAGPFVLGGVGGQLDFMRAASQCPDGVSIVALPSQSKGISRIVSGPVSSVTTPRAEVDVVITEYGAADLRGKTLKERTEAMLRIAHPDFRTQLEENTCL